MLLTEIEGTHGPIGVAVERLNWVLVACLHSVADVTLKEIEHFEELFTDLVYVRLLVLLVHVTHLLESVIGTELDLLRVVDGLFLADRPIEVNVLLFECAHRRRDLLHQKSRVLQRLVVLTEYLVFEDSKVTSSHDLVLERLKVA